ncbi:MAG TPA: UDP-3-O-(3-hydroxymyristoyl)glucosamine N-acyltransferase [Rhizomicrobium sp.]|jgi:UDP-3-O-[3-hydroxymyristoyl] glucosamine N-acyltransferase|nr:UDP-3-O-(3-hydroxymyristoyl)glucosamine N-acyltransferase [Rhizomicrobium sp.]
MSDKRFFQAHGPFALGRIAEQAGARLAAPEEAGIMVRDVADLFNAGDGDVALFCDSAFADAFAHCYASAIVTSEKLASLPHNGSAMLLADDPRAAFARIGRIFYPGRAPTGRIHPSACIAGSAEIGEGVEVAAGAVIGENVVIGAHCRIGANAVIDAAVTISEGSSIGANSSISHALIGKGVTIGSNVSIGGEGFGFVPCANGLVKVSQLGRVLIGDQVEIGSNCSIDRGCLGDTVIGEKTALDNLVQIGHNVRIGKACVFAGQAGVAGSTTIGDRVMVGGAVSISDHLTIGDGAKIAGKSGVMRDVAAGEIVAGYPAVPARQWHRQTAALARLIARKCAGKP